MGPSEAPAVRCRRGDFFFVLDSVGDTFVGVFVVVVFLAVGGDAQVKAHGRMRDVQTAHYRRQVIKHEFVAAYH